MILLVYKHVYVCMVCGVSFTMSEIKKNMTHTRQDVNAKFVLYMFN